MRLLPEIRLPFDNIRSRVGNTGASFVDEIESGIRKIVAEELLSRRPAKAVDERIKGLYFKRVLEPFRRLVERELKPKAE